MLKGKSLFDYTNLFSPNDYDKNDIIILKYFREDLNNFKMYCNVYNKCKKSKRKTKMPYIF